jgi:predicted aspartyl protease
MTCDGSCAAWDNDTDVVAIGEVSTAQIDGITAEQLINAERGPDGSLPDISFL